MRKRNLLTGLFLVVALMTEAAMAVSCSRCAGSVTVLARGPAGLRIEGKGSEISVEEEASALVFRVPIAPLETGIGLRDAHMRKLLEAEKYPAATLRISRSELTFPAERQPSEGAVDADFTLHGQSHPVKVRYHAELASGGITKVRGSFELDLRDYDIQAPSYLGVSVAPKVEVKAELAVTGQGTRPPPLSDAQVLPGR